MRSREEDADKIMVMGTMLLCDFSEALGKRGSAALCEAEERVYQALQDEAFREQDLRRIYFQMIYQMELREGYIASGSESAWRIYTKLQSFHTREEFHREFIRRIRHTDCLHESAYSETVAGTIRHIQNELDNENLSIRLLARYAYLTPNYLAAVFKKETGTTIGQYCLNQRMERAKELLKNRTLKLHEIARMVGYRDAEYFSKIFKREVGCTPSRYRESLSGGQKIF